MKPELVGAVEEERRYEQRGCRCKKEVKVKIICQVAKSQNTYNETVGYLLNCSYYTNKSRADLLQKSNLVQIFPYIRSRDR